MDYIVRYTSRAYRKGELRIKTRFQNVGLWQTAVAAAIKHLAAEASDDALETVSVLKVNH